MSFFQEVIQKVFEPLQNRVPAKPVRVQEKLTIDTDFEARYHQWLQEADTQSWFHYLFEGIRLQLNGIQGPSSLQCFSMDATRGFAIVNKEKEHDERFRFLLHHLFSVLSQHGYIPQKSGRQLEDRGAFVEVKEGYYMKPNPYLGLQDGEKLNQLYGNTTLELVYADKRASYLKVVTTWYSDHNFQDARPFEELLNAFFKN
jgi:hypothetical protein